MGTRGTRPPGEPSGRRHCSPSNGKRPRSFVAPHPWCRAPAPSTCWLQGGHDDTLVEPALLVERHVVLEIEAPLHDVVILGCQPAETRAAHAERLGHAACRHATLVEIDGCGRELAIPLQPT